MNQPIGPLPVPPASGKEVVEGPSLFFTAEESDSKDFNDLLESELEDEPTEHNKARECEAWCVYGHAEPMAQLPQIVLAISTGTERGALTEESMQRPAGGVAQAAEESIEPAPMEQDPPLEDEVDSALTSLLRTMKPAQQNLPAPLTGSITEAEQIAGKPVESGKIISGIPVAQEPPMLFASQKEEESAQWQNAVLSEASGGANRLEAEIPLRIEGLSRLSEPKSEFEAAEITPVSAVPPEWSSFESVADLADIQAPRKVEGTEMVDAIRTHVELLRGSSQSKMDVILRPDGQTELFLHVEKVNGQILVQARCDRGDFARLEANWSGIQQSLATQGVRVEALQNGATLNNDPHSWNNSENSTGKQFSSREERHDGFIEQEPSTKNRPKQSVATNGSERGWQSWA
jgi:hypothetical protein